MSATLKIVNDGQFLASLKAAKGRVDSSTCLSAVQAGGFIIEKNGKLNIDKSGLRDTGALINSYHLYDAEATSNGAKVDVGSRGVIYARIHEFGGTIHPKRAKYLAIPATKGGRNKASRSPGSYPGLEFIPTAAGGVLLDAKDNVMFVLVRQVTIPARAYHRPAVDSSVSEVQGAIASVLSGALS